MSEYFGKKPITVITGCLGSGKTTLIQNILNDKAHEEKLAIIVNEFGSIGLDHHLIRQAEEKTVLLNGGCICCNSREDLEEELKSLLYLDESGQEPFDRIIIETTGLADPAPILFTILSNPLLQNRFVVDCVITTFDAKNGSLHIKNNPEVLKQLSVADKVVVTKVDIASQEEINFVVASVKRLNPTCEIIYSDKGNVNVEIIKGDKKTFKPMLEPNKPIFGNHYSSEVQSISFTFKQPLDWISFGLWLSMLLHAEGENVLRVKGMLDVGEEGPIILNGVQHIIHPPQHLTEWPENDRLSHIVFILRGIEPNKIKESLFAFQNFLNTEIDVLEYSYSL